MTMRMRNAQIQIERILVAVRCTAIAQQTQLRSIQFVLALRAAVSGAASLEQRCRTLAHECRRRVDADLN